MRTVYFGTPELAIPPLEALLGRHEISAVVCQPDKPQGRSGKPAPPPVKVFALEHGLDVHQPAKLNDGAFQAWLRAQKPDICTLAAYGRLLKQPLLDIPPHGWLNLHPSLLPKLRGPSPIRTAILEGLEETGVSIMRISMEMDAGDVLLQEKVGIGPEENALELSARLSKLGAELLLDAIERVEQGTATYQPQDDAHATFSHMLEKHHGQICWAKSAFEIHNLVRAMLPWPVAHCLLNGKLFRLFRAELGNPEATGLPGAIVQIEKNHLEVATGSGSILLREVQPSGKRVMNAGDFLRGHALTVGDRFEEIA